MVGMEALEAKEVIVFGMVFVRSALRKRVDDARVIDIWPA